MLAEDIPPVAAWMVQYPLWQDYGLTEARAGAIMTQGLADGHPLLVVDLGDDKACAFAYVVPRGAFGLSPYLRWLAVRPGLNSAGIGGHLLAAVEAQSRTVRNELFLLAAEFNTSAQRFYERHGYTRVGVLPDYVVSGVTEVIYWKRLHEETEVG
jgi:ribosomal protein S18 acetylase RimI-like enzyme